MRKLKNHKIQPINTNHCRKRVPFIQNQAFDIRQDDKECQFMCQTILQKLDQHKFTKHTKIRLQAWLERLNRIQYNKIWRQNRNNYLKLLDLMIQCQVVCYPFSAFPARQELCILQKHDLDQIINEIEKTVKLENHDIRKQSLKQNKVLSYQQKEQQIDNTTTTKSLNKIQIKEQAENEKNTISISKILMKRFLCNGKRNESVKSQISQDVTQNGQQKERNSVINFDTSKVNTKSYHNNFRQEREKQAFNGATNLNEALNFQKQPGLISYAILTQAQKDKINTSHSNSSHTKVEQSVKISSQIHKKISEQALNKVKSNSTNFGIEKDFTKDRQYWQSNSLAQNGTPRYLNFYPSHPYVSLALSETEEILITTRSKDYNCCDCFSEFLPKIRTKDICIRMNKD